MKKQNSISISQKIQSGSSLIEVLIALFVLAIGLLGILAMQSRAVQLNQNAYLYSQAEILSTDMMDAIQTSPGGTGGYAINYDDPTPAPPSCATSAGGCNTPRDIAVWNVSQWRTNIENLLPGGEGEIEPLSTTPGVDMFIIKIRFQIGRNQNTGDAIEDEVRLVVASAS